MTQTVFEKMKTAISVLKLDFTTEEFATLSLESHSEIYTIIHAAIVI